VETVAQFLKAPPDIRGLLKEPALLPKILKFIMWRTGFYGINEA